MSDYLAKQLSGPLAQGTIDTVLAQYTPSDEILQYWYGLSIDTAADAELEAIGYLVGLPWPAAPAGTLDDNSFILGSAALYPTASPLGLSGVGLLTGGVLGSDGASEAGLIPSSAYRIILVAYAYLKWNGLNWRTIDAIAASFGELDYVFTDYEGTALTLGSSSTYPEYSALLGLSTGRLSSTSSAFPDSDIIINYLTPISLANLWIINLIFDSVCTAPKVTARNGV